MPYKLRKDMLPFVICCIRSIDKGGDLFNLPLTVDHSDPRIA